MLTNKASSAYHHDTLFNGSVNFAFSITYLKIQDDSLLKCTHNTSPSIRTNAIKNIKKLKNHIIHLFGTPTKPAMIPSFFQLKSVI
ncbi:hypothetical protein EMIT0P258_80156 [Pseudomonas sp. IT-P258]